ATINTYTSVPAPAPPTNILGADAQYVLLADGTMFAEAGTVVSGGDIGAQGGVSNFPPAVIEGGSIVSSGPVYAAALAAVFTARAYLTSQTYVTLASSNMSTSGNGATPATYLPGNY